MATRAPTAEKATGVATDFICLRLFPMSAPSSAVDPPHYGPRPS
ncbi:hypothetical protein ACFFX0_24515 [Citricoccus parietis]|uniref:Uncharacterized protein n=1 Tax=Citricoccus parietis TaxID=592307 RepID=A0ABV5G5G6_9MICC